MRTPFAAAFAALALSTAGAASDHGTPEEAQAMLQRAVEAIKADEPAALAAINDHDPRFLDRDLYVVCGGDNGRLTAHALKRHMVGSSLRDFVDRGGRPVGRWVYEAAVEGEMRTVEYAYPEPGEVRPGRKVAFVTRVADQVCVVGYYK